ncbi:hypothetical protein OHA72_10660 [Dactylosporangium sp. NBC_01737]|uniref:hypothetical protein n=1 Tax=Dactylosporangium sp. NBC_01737 TaxID=2975959 RepID=UPI002E158BB1|nr:hypothetical protein OHA72_10660 [Dactylosporangium sp. NBC_01737]
MFSEGLVFERQFVDDGGVGADDLFQAFAVLAEPIEFSLELVVRVDGPAERGRGVAGGSGQVLEVVA